MEILKDSELRYRRLFEAAQDGILILDARTGMIEDVNPFLIKMLGYTREEFLKKKLWEVGAFKDVEASQDAFKALQEEEYIRYDNLPLKGKDGRLIQVEFVSNVYWVGSEKVIQCNIRDITTRWKAEEALHASEERYRLLVETLPDGVVVHSQGRVIFANPASATIIGAASPGDLTWMPVIEFVHPDYREMVLTRIQESQSKGTPLPLEEEVFIRLDGTPIDVEVSANPFSYNGKPAMLTVFNDITIRKRAEQEIANLAKFSSENPNPVLRLSWDGILLYANAQSNTLLKMWECKVGDHAPQFWRDLASLSLASEKNKSIEIECDEVIYEMIVTPVSESGYVNLYASDISNRKKAEEALQASTRILEGIIDTIPARVFWKDKDLVYLGCNAIFAHDAGFTDPKDIIGKDDFQMGWRDQAELYRADDRLVIESGSSKILVEEPQTTPDGHFITLLTSKVPLRSSKGEVIGVLGTYMDITERQQREKEIHARTDELTTLYKLSRALADANDLEIVLELVNRHAVESIHTTFSFIALLEDGELVSRAFYPIRSLDHDFKIGTRTPISALPYCQRVLDKNEPVILQNDNPEIDSIERAALLLDFVQSVCLIPLRVSDSSQNSNLAMGMLILGEARNVDREPFRPEKIHLARTIGDQAASAIRRLLHREQAGRRLQHLASLSEIDRNIASNFNLNLSLKIVLQHVIEQMEVDAADVLVFNTGMQDLEYAAGSGFRSTVIKGKRLRLGEGLAGRAALERINIQIPDCAASGTVFSQAELLAEEHVAAYFAVPLISKGQVKGVLEIYHRTPLKPNKEWLDFLNTLAGQAAIAIDVVQLFDNLQRSNTELAMAYDATIKGWSYALDMRDKETEGHTQRVTEVTLKLGRAFGLSEAELVQVRWGALLHDIGKMGVPDGILHKPGPLTEEEWVLMKKHPSLAYELLSPIRYLRQALDIPYCHHEKWDGTGYPRGLKGEQIPLIARIFAVIDVWDALNSDRPYRAAWSEEKVLDHIRSLAGTHFDPQVVKTCLESGLIDVYASTRS